MSNALRASLWVALNALPPPVDRAAILACAEGVLNGKPLADFRAWLDKNEIYLLRRLNG